LAPFQERWGDRVHWEVLPSIRDRLVERLVRQSKVLAQLYLQHKQKPEVQLKMRRRPFRWADRVIEAASRGLGRLGASARGTIWLDRLHQAVAARAGHMLAFDAFLRRVQPDVVFC